MKMRESIMRVAKFICDGCEKTAETKNYAPPEGWMEFNILCGQRFAVDPGSHIHACSEACVAKAASKAATTFFNEIRRR